MWYQAPKPKPVKAPTRREKWILRSLILLGLAGMGLFLHTIYQEEVIGYRPLYYLLVFSLTFLAFRITYEWYHYFSISKSTEPPLEKDFSVDVLTTFCPGEPYEMILETLEAIQAIEYPHTTYLCDEANDPYLIEQCKRLGVVHVTRNNRQNAKAGNINNALQQATGDICLILDPDHVPAPDYLHRVLPYFQDPAVGFVQVVQAYKNINENIIAKGSAQQTFQFYGPIMMSMNSYGTAQAIGANCTFRRAALDSIGGHAPGLAEDMNTSMKLHAQGWKSRYVPLVLSRGLVPNTISAYFKQQLKWSRGVFELLVTTYRQNFSRFTLRQKFHYGLLPWHYFSGAIYLINFLVPILSLVLGLIPMKINLPYFFLMGMPFFASIYAVRHYVQRWVMEEDERGNHLVGGLLLIGTWYIHLLGFIFTLLRRKVPYDPTPKDNQEENILGPNLPNVAVALLSIAAIAYGLWLDYNPYSLFMAGFAALNCVFMGFMLLISYQNQFRRFKARRHRLARAVAVISFIKKQFWILRHRFLYRGLRILALPLLLGFLGLLYYWGSQPTLQEIKPKAYPPPQKSHFLGWYLPGQNGRTHIPSALNLGAELGFKPQIISSYLAWKPLEQQAFPKEHIDSIFAGPQAHHPWATRRLPGKDGRPFYPL
jgi:glycosyltransferase involved in cell wall biosynthesis